MKPKVKIGRQKLLIIISTIILVSLAIVGLAMAFLLSYNGYSPKAPQIIDDGKNIYITCQSNENYSGYRFKLSSDGKDILIDSKTNIINSDLAVKKGAVLGNEYDVSACFVADKEGNNSEYSKSVKWLCSQYLDSPKIEYQTEQNVLIWNEINHANFYKVYINGNEEFIKVVDPQFDLTAIEGGEYSFSVIACSDKSYYKESASSNILEIEIIQTLKGFSSINFDLGTKMVTAICEKNYQKVEILLNSSHYIIKDFDITQENDYFVYKINLSLIYDNHSLIGILPVEEDEFNIVDKNSIKYFTVVLPENPENMVEK